MRGNSLMTLRGSVRWCAYCIVLVGLFACGCTRAAPPPQDSSTDQQSPPSVSAAPDARGDSKSSRPVLDQVLYAPRAEDFQPAYDSDALNKQKQTFAAYFGWVKAFHEGNFLVGGWTYQSGELVKKVPSDPEKSEVRTRLNELGRLASAEWAKDSSARRLDNAELEQLGVRLRKAIATSPQAAIELLDKELVAMREKLKPK